jgi:hypothetical protein
MPAGALAAATLKMYESCARLDPATGGMVTIGILPAPQVVQVDEPGTAKDPVGHIAHWLALPPELVLAGHGVHNGAACPEYDPAEQGRHMSAFGGEKVPARQREHEPEPAAENVPAKQGSHDVAPARENVPG